MFCEDSSARRSPCARAGRARPSPWPVPCGSMAEPHRREEEGSGPGALRVLPGPSSALSAVTVGFSFPVSVVTCPLFPAVQPLPQSELDLPACPGQPKWSRWLCSPEGPAAPGQAGWRGQWFRCHSSRVPAWTTGLRAEHPVCVRPFAVTLPALAAEARGARSSARSVDPFCEVRVVAATARDGVVSCPGPPPSCDCPQLNEGCLCFRPQ